MAHIASQVVRRYMLDFNILEARRES